MRPTTEPEHLSAHWDTVNRRLAELSAGRDHTLEGHAVGDEERALLEALDRIEGRLGERRRVRGACRSYPVFIKPGPRPTDPK